MAISVGNLSNGGVIAAASSETFAHDNNGDDVIVLVAIRDTETAATATATYAGEAMTADVTHLVEDSDSTADLRCYAFRKQGAATGSNNVVVTFSNAIDHGGAFAASVSDLNDTGQPDVTGTGGSPLGGAGPADPSVTVTTVASDTILFDVVYNKTGNALTKHAAQTQIGNLSPNGGGDRCGASYKIVSASGSQSMSWTTASAPDQDDWGQVVVAYKQAEGAAPAPTAKVFMTTRTKFF